MVVPFADSHNPIDQIQIHTKLISFFLLQKEKEGELGCGGTLNIETVSKI